MQLQGIGEVSDTFQQLTVISWVFLKSGVSPKQGKEYITKSRFIGRKKEKNSKLRNTSRVQISKSFDFGVLCSLLYISRHFLLSNTSLAPVSQPGCSSSAEHLIHTIHYCKYTSLLNKLISTPKLVCMRALQSP